MTPPSYPHLVIATIRESILPVDRGRKYEDPLDAVLQAAGLGAVTGGGTQLDDARRVVSADIEVELADTGAALELLRTTLQRLGAPAGSVLNFTGDGQRVVLAIDSGAATSTPAVTAVPQYDEAVVRKTAEKLLTSYRTLFAESYAYGPITPGAYEREVFAWYDETTAAFATLGFTALGDLKVVKDATKLEPGAGPFARRFVSGDHLHRAEIFQLKSPKSGTWTRVLNLVTEVSDGRFVWTSTSVPSWTTPDHILREAQPPATSPAELYRAHVARVVAHLASRDGLEVVAIRSLDDVLASENRCQARIGAFRRWQAMPTVEELERLGTEPTLARLVHEAMRAIVAGGPTVAASPGAEWQVTTVELTPPRREAMSLGALIEFALDQGLAQVEKAGSPLHPFLVTERGRAWFFVRTKGDGDPMAIALETLRAEGASATACALVMDSRIALGGGEKVDAVVVMVSQRDGGEGEVWAAGYRPKGLLRAFKRLPLREKVAASKNLFAEATG